MKKLIVLISVALLSFSQNTKAEVDLGVIGGVHSTSLKIEPAEDFDVEGRTAFGAGLFLNAHLNEVISLQITPMYLQKGRMLVLI